MRLTSKQLLSIDSSLHESFNLKPFLDRNPWLQRLLGFAAGGRPEKFQEYASDPKVQGPLGIVGSEMTQAAKRKIVAPYLLAPRTLGNVEADLGRMNRLEKHAQIQYGAYKT